MSKKEPKIVVGTDYFPKFIQENALFVDKSLLIQDIIDDGAESILFTRPRRWGKSLNMSMLQHFFAARVADEPTQGLFDNLQIATIDNGHYMQYQGQHPVIYITFKDVEVHQYPQAMERIYTLITKTFIQFPELADSDKLPPELRAEYQKIRTGKANKTQMCNALLTLSECLYKHHGKKVYILIDEYDKPLNIAYRYDYFEDLVLFFKEFFGAGFKGNIFLQKGILTGVLRLAKAGLFSGLNNFQEYTLLDNKFAHYFGFTEDEVSRVFALTHLTHDSDHIKAWYNGYIMGDSVVMYNPWSIMSCVQNDGKLQPYWVDSADNSLIKKCLINSSESIKRELKMLLEGKTIQVDVQRHVTFDDLTNSPSALWSLLLYAGYLRVHSVNTESDFMQYDCQVSIPNKEVLKLFNSFIVNWFNNQLGCIKNAECLQHLLSANVSAFTHDLRSYLISAASTHDTGNNSELFYHGFLLALVIQLRATHHIRSNRESGFGRYDVIIIPKSAAISDLGIVLEFKRVTDAQQLESTAKKAVQQIDEKQYDHELREQPHIKKILRIGMAFVGKLVISAHQTFDCQQQSLTELAVHHMTD
jgi:hypothetical protein